jgi:hypothetical protein
VDYKPLLGADFEHLAHCRKNLSVSIENLDTFWCILEMLDMIVGIEGDRARLYRRTSGQRASLTELDCLGVAAAPGYGKPWSAFARQKFTRSRFDQCSNHLE